MGKGSIALVATPREVFAEADLLGDIRLDIPHIAKLMRRLRERGMDVPEDIYTVEEAKEAILQLKRGEDNA